MKHLKYLLLLIGITFFASCSDTDVDGGLIADANQANFSGKIGELQTRVTENSWENGDAVGIYALNAGAELSETTIFDGKSNVKYTSDAEGVFTAAATPINFPNEGDLDFVAYYPYHATITDYKYNIDVTDQSNLADIDLLYSNNAKGQNKSNPNVALNFNHMLSKLVLNIQLGENLTSLQGLTASINDVIVDGELALADGVVTTGTTRKDITPHVTVASGSETATVAGILVPGQDMKDVTIVFNLGENKYEWTPTSQELNSTYRYAYTVKLNVDESGQPIVVPVKIGATINDWNDPNIGDTPIVLDPEKEDPVAGDKIDIVDFRAAVANGELYTEDKYIEGEVILNPANQTVNNAVAAIADGTAGITLFFGWDDDVAAAMPLGAKVKVSVKDGKWNVYNGLVQFEVNVAKVEIVEETAATPLQPRVATIQDIVDGKYQSDLVQLNDVQFKDVPSTYSGNNALINSASDEVNVYTRNQAAFADDNVPEGNGPFIGVVNHFNNPQLAIRKVDDLAGMTGDRFDDEGGTDPQPGVGDGTKENPYTVAQAIAKQGETDVWVKGYIVGSFNNGSIFGTENASEYNINIADNKDETSDSKVVNVQLTTTKDIRANLNLINNSDVYKKEVLFKGDLVKYNNLPGIKNTKEYEIVTEGGTDPTPDPIEFTTDKSTVALNADTELTSIVKLTTDAAQAWTVASDATWLTVAPASGSGNGDIVLTDSTSIYRRNSTYS